MAVPARVSTFVEAEIKKVWKSCHNKYKSSNYGIFSQNDKYVLFEFVMSLIVTITFASITATVLFVFDSDSVYQDSRFLVTELHVSRKTENSVRLEWKRSVLKATRYEVQISSEMSDLALDVDAWTETYIDIDSLTSGVRYSLSVTSFITSDDKQEIPLKSEIISISTNPAVPGMVDRLKSTIKSTSFNLWWIASEGMVDAYIVKIAGDSSFRAEYRTRTDEPNVLIENLEINTLYQLEIYAVRGDMRSEHRTESLKTKDKEGEFVAVILLVQVAVLNLLILMYCVR